ncbi:MAG: GIY-YIG nuclease family protein [Thermosynechococcaceae cyanobacterium]
MDTENSSLIEHQNVPQAHRGLHDFLYDAEDEHGVETVSERAQASNLDAPQSVEAWCNAVQNAKIAGVYAVLNSDRQTQYIGYSRNVALSLRSHLTQKGAAVCAFVAVAPFKFPKREDMEQLRDQWIAELPSLPPGNLDGTWAGTVQDAAKQVMSAAEREAYEAKKLKLRRAMADDTLNRAVVSTPSEVEQRQKLAAALNDDNWSAVIQEQTQQTQEP